MIELPPNDAALQTEAWVVNAGFTAARDYGVPYEKALEIATRPDLIGSSLAVGSNLQRMQAEMVALVVQKSEVLDTPGTYGGSIVDYEDEEDRRIRKGAELFDSLSPEKHSAIRKIGDDLLARMQEPGSTDKVARAMDDLANRSKNI